MVTLTLSCNSSLPSDACRLNTYVPTSNSVTDVVDEFVDVILAFEGPEICSHRYWYSPVPPIASPVKTVSLIGIVSVFPSQMVS